MSAKILQFKSSKKQKFLQPIKYSPHIHGTLGSRTAALLFAVLEYHFQKKPEGFYMFVSPCNNSLYREGNSLCEMLGVSRTTISRILELICTRYKSKSLYNVACEQYGELGVFRGKPYLSYQNRQAGQTFYSRNHSAVQEIRNGTYQIKYDKNAKN